MVESDTLRCLDAAAGLAYWNAAQLLAIMREVVVRSVSEQRPKGKGGLLYLMLHATEPLSCDLPASPP